MRWASGLSRNADVRTAFDEAASSIEATTNAAGQAATDAASDACDLILLFVSAEHASNYNVLSTIARERFASATIVGCSANGVIGSGKGRLPLSVASRRFLVERPCHGPSVQWKTRERSIQCGECKILAQAAHRVLS